ncbi:nucleotidyltransferase [Bacillus phage 278BB001]|nr:nucleotidyltransferase [Bacillus phage 278BB001]
MEERKLSFKSVVGSQNYNLATPKSDVDELHFAYPSLEDIYKGNFVKKVETSNERDYAVHDVRMFAEYLCKGNPNVLETLFSVRTVTNDRLFSELYNIRHRIATMNLPAFNRACRGMFKQQHLKAEKALFRPKADYAAVGKHIAAAMRIADLAIRFHSSSFKNYEGALWYEEGTHDHATLVGLKLGKGMDLYDLNEYYNELEEYESALGEIFDDYNNCQVDTETQQNVQNTVRGYFEEHLRKELEKGML